jgi:hypothetical protein
LSSSITQTGKGTKDLLKALQNVSVTVGIHEAEGGQQKKDFEHAIGPVQQRPEGSEPTKGKRKQVKWKTFKDDTVDLITVAAAHEFGIGTVRRSFIADWFDGNEPEIRVALQKIATAGVKRGMPLDQAMKRFGAWCVGQIQQRIADGIAPELSERRKAEKAELSGKAKDTPLILTGQLRSSIRSNVYLAGSTALDS